MTLSKRDFLALGGAIVVAGPGLAFTTSPRSRSPLPGIDVILTRDPVGEPIAPIHIDGEHGKALVKMGPKQAATLLSNILAPKLQDLSGISGKTWHWVLVNHLSDDVIKTIFEGGGTELAGLQFAEDNGAITWGLKIMASPAQ